MDRRARVWRVVGVVLLCVLLLASTGLYWFTRAPGEFHGPQCTRGSAVCREVTGRVLYVEEQDPDGDGDVHLVLFSRDSLTRRYISVLKLKRAERSADRRGFGRWVGATGRPYNGEGGERNLRVRKLQVDR